MRAPARAARQALATPVRRPADPQTLSKRPGRRPMHRGAKQARAIPVRRPADPQTLSRLQARPQIHRPTQRQHRCRPGCRRASVDISLPNDPLNTGRTITTIAPVAGTNVPASAIAADSPIAVPPPLLGDPALPFHAGDSSPAAQDDEAQPSSDARAAADAPLDMQAMLDGVQAFEAGAPRRGRRDAGRAGEYGPANGRGGAGSSPGAGTDELGAYECAAPVPPRPARCGGRGRCDRRPLPLRGRAGRTRHGHRPAGPGPLRLFFALPGPHDFLGPAGRVHAALTISPCGAGARFAWPPPARLYS